METYVFFTKGRTPKRYRAETQTQACEKFYADHPDFHLSELKDIRIARTKRNKQHWLKGSNIVQET